jgi:hypothetical protein
MPLPSGGPQRLRHVPVAVGMVAADISAWLAVRLGDQVLWAAAARRSRRLPPSTCC